MIHVGRLCKVLYSLSTTGHQEPQPLVHLEQQEVDAEITKTGEQPLAAPQARGNRTLLGEEEGVASGQIRFQQRAGFLPIIIAQDEDRPHRAGAVGGFPSAVNSCHSHVSIDF